VDPCVYDVFDSELALELNPEVVTLTPWTPCICECNNSCFFKLESNLQKRTFINHKFHSTL